MNTYIIFFLNKSIDLGLAFIFSIFFLKCRFFNARGTPHTTPSTVRTEAKFVNKRRATNATTIASTAS